MNGDGDGLPIANIQPLREDPDRVSLEEHIAYQQQLNHNQTQTQNQNQNHDGDNNPQMRITSENISDHIMSDASRLSRLSSERNSIFEDRLSPERELQPSVPLLSPSRHVSPARDSMSPEPRSEPSYTPAPTAESSTPPPTLPTSSFATGSTRATSTAGTSEQSFEMLSGYDPISPADRHRQWQREQRREIYNNGGNLQGGSGGFRPNADLPFPITPQLLQYYPYPGQHPSSPQQHQRTPLKEDFVNNLPGRRYSEVGHYQEQPIPQNQIHRSHGGQQQQQQQVMMYDSRFSNHGSLPPLQRPSSVQNGLNPHYRSSSSEVSVGGSSCSGIPSFAREFEGRGRGWRFDPIHTAESSHHSPPPPPSSNFSTPRKEESIASVYVNEFASQIDSLLRYAKRPFVAIMILGFFGFVLSTLVNNFSAASPETWGENTWNITYAGGPGTRASYADFPTLMNIESSFEKIVDSAAGGSALARVMKQSEMAVSDLSTVVRYSELKCKETLAERLDVFARDAKGNVRALQGFGSKVGGVLDQLLSINQYALRELSMIKRESQHRPFLYRLLTPTSFFRSTSHYYSDEPDDPRTRARVAETFNKAAEVLESNLRLLVADGETIFTSLTQLTEQHKPIYDEIVREVVDIKKEEAVVLSSLWTKVGGNAAQRKNFRENAELLALIGSYEEQARGYVESTVLELDRMTADLENLRRRVAEPLLISGGSNGKGGKRGRDDDIASIPLSVHLDAIEGAVERLVRKRAQRRAKEGNWLKKIHDGEERARKDDIVVEGAGAIAA